MFLAGRQMCLKAVGELHIGMPLPLRSHLVSRWVQNVPLPELPSDDEREAGRSYPPCRGISSCRALRKLIRGQAAPLTRDVRRVNRLPFPKRLHYCPERINGPAMLWKAKSVGEHVYHCPYHE